MLLKHPFHREVFEYWNRCRGMKIMPSESAIFPRENYDFLPNMLWIDVKYNPLNFRYRKHGAALTKSYGLDPTGKSVRELPPAGLGALMHEQYREVIKSGEPGFHNIVVRTDSYKAEYDRLTLPISEDEKKIKSLFAVTIFRSEFIRDLFLEESNFGHRASPRLYCGPC